MNTVAPDYPRVISKADVGKGGTTLLYHPSLNFIHSWTISLGQAAWAQFQMDMMILSIVVVYAPRDSTRATSYLWHKLKGELPGGQWVFLGDFNMTKIPLDSTGPSPLLNGRQREA